MTNLDKVTFKYLVEHMDEYDLNNAIYMEKDMNSWGIDAEIILADPDDFDDYDDDDDPVEISNIGYRYVLLLPDLDDIISNLKDQKGMVTVQEIYEAFIFYYRNDAFIVV